MALSLRETAVPRAPVHKAPHPEHKVCIKHLPEKMRSPAMLEAMLEQIGVDREMTACDFAPKGVVVVAFQHAAAAKKCAKHFDGRRWSGNSGTPVIAEVEVAEHDDAPPLPEPWYAQTTLASDASEFVPGALPPPPGLSPPPGLYPPFAMPENPLLGHFQADLKDPWKMTEPVTVVLENLPLDLQSPLMLNFALEHAGLLNAVTNLCMSDYDAGQAFVSFEGKDNAEACIRYFDGCFWSGSPVPVHATLYADAKDEVSTDASSSHE
eukprot:TRINITY_DN13961_c1_g5_i1.p1 TRINITY_DN13961_c1_g5~~TRINITY_DN13961_c1_g5_i1.p1  ORF type:complete len:288 (-),score=56.09 TRINITY_DN13961_c1_g5_i1:275-1072(-)